MLICLLGVIGSFNIGSHTKVKHDHDKFKERGNFQPGMNLNMNLPEGWRLEIFTSSPIIA